MLWDSELIVKKRFGVLELTPNASPSIMLVKSFVTAYIFAAFLNGAFAENSNKISISFNPKLFFSISVMYSEIARHDQTFYGLLKLCQLFDTWYFVCT